MGAFGSQEKLDESKVDRNLEIKNKKLQNFKELNKKIGEAETSFEKIAKDFRDNNNNFKEC